MSKQVAVGIDLGGTNIKIGLVDKEGRIRARHPTPIPTPERVDDALDLMATHVTALLDENSLERADVAGVGLGSPGPLSHVNGVLYRLANLPGWKDVPIREQLERRLDLPVTLENDGNAAAFGEYWVGAACSVAPRGRPGGDLVMLTLGTGIGGGVIIGGDIFRGQLENAGEIGHMIVMAGGLACTCGQRGCLERYASASAVARRVEEAIRKGAASSLADRVTRGERLDSKMVAAAAAADGDALCAKVWRDACDFLAVACVNIQHLYNPARVVFGGGLANTGEQLLDPVRRAFASQRWHLHDDSPDIVPAQLGYDAGLIGAAACAWRGRMHLDTQT